MKKGENNQKKLSVLSFEYSNFLFKAQQKLFNQI